MNKKSNLSNLTHILIKETLPSNSILVDATCGNGHDTLFLCENFKYVYAFDIQEKALNETKERLKHLTNFKLILDNHLNLLDYVKDFNAIVFNLGYLPGSDKTIMTRQIESVQILKTLLNLNHTFKIFMTLYPGHKEGLDEANAIMKYLKDNQVKHYKLSIENTLKESPYLLMIEKN